MSGSYEVTSCNGTHLPRRVPSPSTTSLQTAGILDHALTHCAYASKGVHSNGRESTVSSIWLARAHLPVEVAAERQPNSPAVVSEEQALTYARLDGFPSVVSWTGTLAAFSSEL